MLSRRGQRALLRALRDRPARAARVRAGHLVREGVLPPPVRSRTDLACRKAAGASTACWRGPRSSLFYPELAAVRQPLAGEVAAPPGAARTPAVRDRLWRGDRDADRRVARGRDWTGSRRSTSTCTTTATSRSRRSSRWRDRARDYRRGGSSGRAPGLAASRSSTRRSNGLRSRASRWAHERAGLRSRASDARMSGSAGAVCTSTSTARCSGAGRRSCTTARAACRSTGCARSRPACAPASRSC